MSYKYFGRLAGKTNADVALAHTSPANTHTPFSPQAPATKFLSYGENSTSLAFNRVMAAISTNLDYFAGILDSPALRDDVLTPLINGTLDADGVNKFQAYGPGFSVLRAFNGTTLSLGADGVTSKKCPPTWVFVGLHKSALDRRIRAYSRLDTVDTNGGAKDQFRTELMSDANFAEGNPHFVSPGTQVISPVNVKLYNDAALDGYYNRAGVSQQLIGEEHHGVPKWIPPIQAAKPDLPPYNRTVKNLRIDGWTEDGPIIGGEGESLSDAYMRPGCFLNIFNANDANGTDSNNGLYRIAHIEKSLDSSAGGKGDKVVLTRGGLHKVTVEASSLAADFEAGDLIYWSSKPDHADGTKHFTANKYAYVAYIINRPDLSAGQDLEKKDLYLATFSGAEDFSGEYADGSYLGSQTGIQGGRLSMNDVGLADQEEDASQHWLIPNGTKLYSANSAANTPVGTTEACIPAGYPVKFRTNLSTKGSATPHNPLGFVLNPTLEFGGAGLNSADYYVQCRTLTTVKEKLVSAGTSPNAYANDDPSAKLGFTESDARALTAFTKMAKLGSFWKDGDFTNKHKYTNSGGNQGVYATDVSGSLVLNSGFSSPRNVLGGCLWRLTLADSGDANHVFATEESVEAGQVIWFKHPTDQYYTSYASIISVDGNVLTLWGGFRVLQNNAVAAWDDPIVEGASVIGLYDQLGNAVALNNATWSVASFYERPYVLSSTVSSTGNVRVPHMGLDSAYHADTSQGHAGPGSGNRMWLVPGKPVELMMPGDLDGNGVPNGQTAFSVKSDSYQVNLLLNSLRTGNTHAGIRQWVRTTFAEGNPYPDIGASTALEFTDVNAQTAEDVEHQWIPLTSARNKHFSEGSRDLRHVQDKSILGGISAGILGATQCLPGVVSYVGVSGQKNKEYSAFSTNLISGCKVTGAADPSLGVDPGVFTVLGAKCHFKGGSISLNHNNWTFVYVDFSDGNAEPSLGEEQNPPSFSHPTRVYLYRCRKDANNAPLVVEDLRSFSNRIDAKIDIYVGRKHDIYSHHGFTSQEVDGGSSPNTVTTSSQKGNPNNSDYYSQVTDFGTLRAAFQHIETLETYKRTSATWPGSLETAEFQSDYYSTSYTVHVVSDTFEAVPPDWVPNTHSYGAVLRIPTSGITIKGHLPGHKGGIVTERSCSYDMPGNAGHEWHYDKDTRPMLPTVFWASLRPLIDFGGHGGIVIEDLSFRWEHPNITTSSAQNAQSWYITGDGAFGPNHDPSGAGAPFVAENQSEWMENLYTRKGSHTPRSVLFVNQQTAEHTSAGIKHRERDTEHTYYEPGHAANATLVKDSVEVKTSSQVGDLVISRVSLVGGSGFLWFDSTSCPSYRNIIIEDCEARRVTDLGIHIQGGSGQLYSTAHDPNGGGVPHPAAKNSHSPHESVVVRGCTISQYGHRIPYTYLDGGSPMPFTTESASPLWKQLSWRCHSKRFGAAIHVSCSRHVLVEDNTITAEFSWMKPQYLDAGTSAIQDVRLDRDHLGEPTQNRFTIAADSQGNTISQDLREWFDNGYNNPNNPANNNTATRYGSLHRVLYIERPSVNSGQGLPSKANEENGLGYITVGRITGTVQNSNFTDWNLHVPWGATGRETGMMVENTATDNFHPVHHPYPFNTLIMDEFDTAAGSQDFSLGPRFYVGVANFWRVGVEIGRSPTAHPYVRNPSIGLDSANSDPAQDTKDGYSIGTPYMPVRTYVGKQDVSVRNNNISFIAHRGIDAEGSAVALNNNLFSAFSNGFDGADESGIITEEYKKASMYVLSPVASVTNNVFKPMFLGLDVDVDRDFETYMFEYPSLGRCPTNTYADTVAVNNETPRPIIVDADDYVLRPGRSVHYPVGINSTYLGPLNTALGNLNSTYNETNPAGAEKWSELSAAEIVSLELRGLAANAVVSGNMGFPIKLDQHHGIVTNNNTQGGDITLYAAWKPSNVAGKLAYTVNSNILGATFRSISGDITANIVNGYLTSAIITDNNLQSLDRSKDGTIGGSLNRAQCWVEHNLPKTVNTGEVVSDVYRMSPRIFGAFSPDALVSRPNTVDAIEDWEINNETAVVGGDNVPRSFSGYTRPIHLVRALERNGTIGYALHRTGINAKNTEEPIFPSLTMFGNPFIVGINPAGIAGACKSAAYRLPPADYSDYDVDKNTPCPEGYYTSNLQPGIPTPSGEAAFQTVSSMQDFVERRPYWHIFNVHGSHSAGPSNHPMEYGASAPTPTVFSTFLAPKKSSRGPMRVKQITLNLKIVWRVEEHNLNTPIQNLGADHVGPPTKAQIVNGGYSGWNSFSSSSSKALIDEAGYYKSNYDSIANTIGIRAFINRPHGTKNANNELRPTREDIGQWLCHNMHNNLVEHGTSNGGQIANNVEKEDGVYFTDLCYHHDPAHDSNAGNGWTIYEAPAGGTKDNLTDLQAEALSWPNFGKVARQEDGFNRTNYGCRMYVHDYQSHDVNGVGTDKSVPGVDGPPNPFTASRWSCEGIIDPNNQIDEVGYHSGFSTSHVMSTGSSGPNNDDFLDDGFIEVPMSMRLKSFSMSGEAGHDATTGLGQDVDNIITEDDTIELQFYTNPTPAYVGGMSVRVSKITVEYEQPNYDELIALGYEDEL